MLCLGPFGMSVLICKGKVKIITMVMIGASVCSIYMLVLCLNLF